MTTTVAHRLNIGDRVTISGCSEATFNDDLVILTKPTALTLTAAQTGTDVGAVSNSGYLYYTNGQLPLLASTDVPNAPISLHDAIVQRAIFRLATTVLLSDPQAQAIAPVAMQMVKTMLAGVR
jgi:hypothetical protein